MTNRTSMFTILPPDDSNRFSFVVPDATTAMVKQRLREYLPELLEPLGHNDGEALADEIVLLAGVYLAADGRSTVAKRKARVAAMLKAMQQAETAFDVVNAMMVDDPDFVQRPCVGLVIDAMSGIFAARDALIDEQAQLGPGNRGDSTKVENPTQLFLRLASILWMRETSRRSDELDPDYVAWRALLFEVVTGEADRSFAKAIRNR